MFLEQREIYSVRFPDKAELSFYIPSEHISPFLITYYLFPYYTIKISQLNLALYNDLTIKFN